MNKISGVYKITNNITSEFYVGSSCNIKQRWADHKSPSKWKGHSGIKLYQAFIKYGLNNFTFDIIEETADLKKREQYWIEQLKPTYNDRHAKGLDTERSRLYRRKYYKEYHYTHRDERLTYDKAYNQAHRDEHLAYNNRLCLYEGETLTLNALSIRFYRQGITNPTTEAKKYLI